MIARPLASAQPQADHGAFDTFAEEPAQDYGMASGEVPPSDPRRQLQAFDALYDQPPQIALGSTEPARRAAQDFFESERVDADFRSGIRAGVATTPTQFVSGRPFPGVPGASLREALR